MIYAQQSTTFEGVYESGTTGLVGTVAVRIEDNQGNIVFGPTTTSIIEFGSTGIYSRDFTAPADLGQYTIVWTYDGTFDDKTVSHDALVVVASTVSSFPPLDPPTDSGIALGPCSAWTTSELVSECCSNAEVGSMTALLDDAVAASTEMLWLLSGRLFNGLCERTVRPCASRYGCYFQVLSRGHIVGELTRYPHEEPYCGCRPLDRIKLPGYPVREILEVLIDGSTVDPTTYRLDRHRWLTRVRDPADPDTVLLWPSCAQMDLPSTESGTFEVTYTYGQDPPQIGREAARELACQVYLACSGAECQLPQGTTRITRQGLTIERTFFARDPATNAWRTGLQLVDAFLNAVNPNGLVRRPIIATPGRRRYAPTLG